MSHAVAGVAYGASRTGPKSILVGNSHIRVFRQGVILNTSTTAELEVLEGLVVTRGTGDIYSGLTVANIPSTPTAALGAAMLVVVDQKILVPKQDGAVPGNHIFTGVAMAELDRSMIRFAGGETWDSLTDAQKRSLDDALRAWGLTLTERKEFIA